MTHSTTSAGRGTEDEDASGSDVELLLTIPNLQLRECVPIKLRPARYPSDVSLRVNGVPVSDNHRYNEVSLAAGDRFIIQVRYITTTHGTHHAPHIPHTLIHQPNARKIHSRITDSHHIASHTTSPHHTHITNHRASSFTSTTARYTYPNTHTHLSSIDTIPIQLMSAHMYEGTNYPYFTSTKRQLLKTTAKKSSACQADA